MMRDSTQRQQLNQLLTFIVLFIPIFVFVRWAFGLEIPLFTLTPERIELLIQIVVSLIFTAVIWTPLFGYRRVEPNTAVVVKGFNNQIWVYLHRITKPGEPELDLPDNTSNDKWYLAIPFVQTVLAIMPDYQFTFEFPIKDIDTQTPKLARISKVEVRVTCRISDHRTFYFESAALFDRIQHLETRENLKRTNPTLWKKIVQEAVWLRLDDDVRDVVWRWHEHIARDSSLLMRAAFAMEKPSELDPYDLSVNRGNLARHVLHESQVTMQEWGISLLCPLVFESIEIDSKLIDRKTRNKKGELDEAEHNAKKEAVAIKERGYSEAEVRAQNLARVLDVLLNQERIPLSDPLITQVVRAALYSDGEMIWNGVIEKYADGNGKAKTA